MAPTDDGNKKAILVTGATSGIGLALCKQLAFEHSCRVFVGARNMEKGQTVLSGLELPDDSSGSLELVQLDVAEEDSIWSAVDAVTRALGSEKLYALVNNAGVHPRSGLEPEEILDINFCAAQRM
eukprot:scaffold213826_cov37-Prasinocladus_malaysianus.AAC.1